MKRKFRDLKLQQKILLSNMLLFVIPCLILCVGLFYFVQKEGNEQLNESRLVILRQIDEKFEDSFDEIVSYANYFACNADVNKIISKEKYTSEYEKMIDQKELREYFNNSRIIYSNLAYSLEILGFDGKSYSTEDTVEVIPPYPNVEALTEEVWYSSLEENSNAIHYIPVYQSLELQETGKYDGVYAAKLIKNLNSGREVALLGINLSQDWLQNLLERGMQKKSQQFFIMDGDGTIFSSTKDGLIGSSIQGDNYIEKLQENSYGYFPAKVEGNLCQICFVTNKTTGWKVVMYEEQKGFGWISNQLVILILILSVFYLFLAVLMSFYNSRYISRPVKKLKQDMSMVGEGNLSIRTTVESQDELGELGAQFNRMIDKVENLIAELEKKKEEQRTLEINTLQAQINPHFLYNTLASIRFLIEMDMPEQAEESLVALVKLLRRTFSDYRKLISVKEEIQAVENYLILMGNRYQDTFEWSIDIEEQVEICLIPRISIQPLVENSISHGFSNKEEIGHIQILGKVEKKDVVISIIDDGIGGDCRKIQDRINGKEEGDRLEQFNGIGVKNVHERLKLFFGEKYGLSVEETEQGGIRINIRLPQHFSELEN